MKHLLIATGNLHKLAEIQDLFNDPETGLVGFRDMDKDAPEVEETGVTFEENAIIKAVAYAAFYQCWTLADDSGIEVDALDGAPGVYSARYAGVHGDDLANNLKLLADMEGVSERSARFRCAIAISSPSGETQVVDGTVEGQLALTETGDHGFGYDSMFIPDGHQQSFGELPPEIKREISHRSEAVKAAASMWQNMQIG